MTKVVSPAVPLYNGLVFLFVLANFSMATFMDPGVYPRGSYACPTNAVCNFKEVWGGRHIVACSIYLTFKILA